MVFMTSLMLEAEAVLSHFPPSCKIEAPYHLILFPFCSFFSPLLFYSSPASTVYPYLLPSLFSFIPKFCTQASHNEACWCRIIGSGGSCDSLGHGWYAGAVTPELQAAMLECGPNVTRYLGREDFGKKSEIHIIMGNLWTFYCWKYSKFYLSLWSSNWILKWARSNQQSISLWEVKEPHTWWWSGQERSGNGSSSGSLCMWVCVSLSMHLCMYVHLHVYAPTCVSAPTCVCRCVHLNLYMHRYRCPCRCVYVSPYLCARMCM